MSEIVTKNVGIREDQKEYLEDTAINFSKFVRMVLDDRMKEDGYTPEKE